MGNPSLALSGPQPDPGKQPKATYVSLGRTLGRTDLVKGQEGRPGGCGDFPPGLGSTGWCGRPGQPRLLQAASHTRAHPPTPGPRARALTSALAQGYKAAGGRTVRADRADGRRGGRHPRRRTPGRRCLYLLGPAPQFPEPPGQSNPSLTPVQLGAYGGQYCAGGQESQLPGRHCRPVPTSRAQGAGRRQKRHGRQTPCLSAFWSFLPHPRSTSHDSLHPRAPFPLPKPLCSPYLRGTHSDSAFCGPLPQSFTELPALLQVEGGEG